jgi:hypothetical protein
MKTTFKYLICILITFLIGVIVYCYYYFQFWTHIETRHLVALTEFRSDHIKGFRGRQILINKSFKTYMAKIEEFAGKNGLKLIVTHCYRPLNEPSLRGTIVAPANYSNHHAGFAVDFNIKYQGLIYNSYHLKKSNLISLPEGIQVFINEVRNDAELRWGGDFHIEDPIHVDYPINSKNFDKWLLYSELCNDDFINGIPKWKFWKTR